MDCHKIEFKDRTKKPVLGIVIKEDSNYLYFKTRKGTYRFAHDSIEVIEPTAIPFDGEVEESG